MNYISPEESRRLNSLTREEREKYHKHGMELINLVESNPFDSRPMTAEETQTVQTYFESLFTTDTQNTEPENELNLLRTYAGKEIFASDFQTAAEMREALNRANEEIKALKINAEFWLAHEKQQNAEFEEDYLAIWEAVKQPNLTVLESVVALKRETWELQNTIALCENEVAQVYVTLTNGKFSKMNTCAKVIIDAINLRFANDFIADISNPIPDYPCPTKSP